MSMLIKGIDFPTKENFMTQLYLICDKDGDWYAVDTTNKDLYKLIEVKEPHGRLGDLDALIEKYGEWYTEEGTESGYIGTMKNLLKDAQTVIEAEGETE